MSAEARRPVVVVGAGLVGALWSLFLARRGFTVHLYERGPDPRERAPPPGRSTHLIISARGWKAIATAAAEERVRRVCVPLAGREIHSTQGTIAFQPYGGPGQAIWAVDRSELNSTLASLAAEHPNIHVSFNRRCVNADLDRMTLELEDTRSGERLVVAPERVFAADGAFSRVRLSMLRMDRFEYSQHYVPYAHKELGMAGAAGRLSPNRTHVWPRRKLLLIAFPNHDGTFTATLIMPFEGETSFASLERPAELRAFFQSHFPDAIELMPRLEEDFFGHPTLSPVTMRCSPWIHLDKIALIGDAAHAMVPFLGQGMNCGFEDCSVLDELISRHGDDWATIFREYQRARKPNADAVTDMSATHFTELAELIDDPRFLLQKAIELKIHRLHPDRYMPLYPMIAFTHTPYAEVRDMAAAQDRIAKEIMSRPRIAEEWDSPEVEQQIAALVKDLPARSA